LNVVVHKHSRKKPKNSAERETFFFETFPSTSWSRTSLDQTKSVELTAFACAFPVHSLRLSGLHGLQKCLLVFAQL